MSLHLVSHGLRAEENLLVPPPPSSLPLTVSPSLPLSFPPTILLSLSPSSFSSFLVDKKEQTQSECRWLCSQSPWWAGDQAGWSRAWSRSHYAGLFEPLLLLGVLAGRTPLASLTSCGCGGRLSCHQSPTPGLAQPAGTTPWPFCHAKGWPPVIGTNHL